MFLLAFAGCTGDTSPVEALFALPPADLGDPRAASSGFDPADGVSIGRALDASLPVFEAVDPGWETPIFLFDELLTDARVRDENQCPFVTVSGETTTHEGGCRSSGGYEFTGSADDKGWTEDGVTWRRLDLDLEVVGDTDEIRFDRVLLQGTVQRGVPSDGSVDAHVDINLHLEVIGYFERHAEDPRQEAWADWTMAGAWEEKGDTILADLNVDMAGSGGMMIQSESLVARSTCPVEVEGVATLGEGVTAELAGAQSCDRCADVAYDGGSVTACAPE